MIVAVGLAFALSACGGTDERPRDTALTVTVHNGSMEPTYRIGDVLTYERAVDIDLGDVVVFHPPGGVDTLTCGVPHEGPGTRRACSTSPGRSSVLLLKRVVGVAGDKLAIRDGRVIRNGLVANEPSIRPCRDQELCEFPDPITVPAGTYYVLGDDRGSSFDSRSWGAVPARYILGTVTGKG